MQNKQLYSDWQQKSGSKNLVEFEKYWPLGCQRIKWEIKKKKDNKKPKLPSPKQNNHHHQRNKK